MVGVYSPPHGGEPPWGNQFPICPISYFRAQNRENRTFLLHTALSASNICVERLWPTFVHPCQNLSSYGMMPPIIPAFKVQKRDRITLNESCQRSWVVASIMLRVKPIWRMISSMPSYKRLDWKGWMLV